MLVRGVVVSYETIRRWCAKFGQAYANQLRRRRPRPGDKWHLDEVFVKINGITGYLWRGIDQHGNVLDVLVQSRRNAKAAKRFFRKLPSADDPALGIFVDNHLVRPDPSRKPAKRQSTASNAPSSSNSRSADQSEFRKTCRSISLRSRAGLLSGGR